VLQGWLTATKACTGNVPVVQHTGAIQQRFPSTFSASFVQVSVAVMWDCLIFGMARPEIKVNTVCRTVRERQCDVEREMICLY